MAGPAEAARPAASRHGGPDRPVRGGAAARASRTPRCAAAATILVPTRTASSPTVTGSTFCPYRTTVIGLAVVGARALGPGGGTGPRGGLRSVVAGLYRQTRMCVVQNTSNAATHFCQLRASARVNMSRYAKPNAENAAQDVYIRR